MKEMELGHGIVAVYTGRGERFQTAHVRVFDKTEYSPVYPMWGKLIGHFCIDKLGRCYSLVGIVKDKDVAKRIKERLDAFVSSDNGTGIGSGETRSSDRVHVKSMMRELKSKRSEFNGVMEEIHGLTWEKEQYTDKEKRGNSAYRMLCETIKELWRKFGLLEDRIEELESSLGEQYLTA